ncbi:MAG: mechanosensitive ion channel domain-containing protein [Bacteroidota bacterium]
METQVWWQRIVIEWEGHDVSVGRLIVMALIIAIIISLAILLLRRWMPRFYNRENISEKLHGKAVSVTLGLVLLGVTHVLIWGLRLDPKLINEIPLGNITVHVWVSTLIDGLAAFWLAMLLDWLIEEYLIQNYYGKENVQEAAQRDRQRFNSVRPVLYTIATIFFVDAIGLGHFRFFDINNTEITLDTLMSAVLIIFAVRLIVNLLIGFALNRYYTRKQLDQGSQYAANRLFTYFAYFFGVILVLNIAGLDLVGIWAGAAALLVGVGIGLQQTFNDLLCGIIILFERSVKVGDVVDINNTIGTVRKIGTRTSMVETRDKIIVFVPNSKLIGDYVINWSQGERRARFHIQVGVAYGSDTDVVKKLLIDAAREHRDVLKFPAPWVRFLSFGDSSLDFDLIFASKEFLRIEDVKSDIRFAIDEAFREHDIEVPFPQHDLWMRGGKGIDQLAGKSQQSEFDLG